MIVISHGDLLDDSAEALVNTVNTEGVSGKGIALQFKLRFPSNYAAYRAASERGEIVLGKVFAVATGLLDEPKWVVNFPTKGHWRSRSRLEDIEAGLDDLIDFTRSAGVTSIAIPPLGCGNGGLAWADVLPLVESKLGTLSELAVHLYPPEGAPAPEAMRVATAKPHMSIGRSVLIAALDSYLQVAEGASRLVAQKLAYLLQVAGAPLRLSFVKAQYGPYAETLNFVLQAMEGHYTVGYGDRTTPSPLQLADGAAAEASEYLARRPELAQAVRRVRALIDGLESPYGLELLSTVHYVATEAGSPATNAKEAAVSVQAWSSRKSRLFSDDHVAVAWHRLTDQGWLS